MTPDVIVLSPNYTTTRTHSIDTITIHCTAGRMTAAQLGNYFKNPAIKASSNYGIGYDGSIGLYVPENSRAWTSSNRENDMRAMTIEVSSSAKAPYEVTTDSMNSLIRLLVDICPRYGIYELKWKNRKDLIGQTDKQNMTVHRWFTSTDCPGEYLMNAMATIAERVNKEIKIPPDTKKLLYRVQVGAYENRENAEARATELRKMGIQAFIHICDG